MAVLWFVVINCVSSFSRHVICFYLEYSVSHLVFLPTYVLSLTLEVHLIVSV